MYVSIIAAEYQKNSTRGSSRSFVVENVSQVFNLRTSFGLDLSHCRHTWVHALAALRISSILALAILGSKGMWLKPFRTHCHLLTLPFRCSSVHHWWQLEIIHMIGHGRRPCVSLHVETCVFASDCPWVYCTIYWYMVSNLFQEFTPSHLASGPCSSHALSTSNMHKMKPSMNWKHSLPKGTTDIIHCRSFRYGNKIWSMPPSVRFKIWQRYITKREFCQQLPQITSFQCKEVALLSDPAALASWPERFWHVKAINHQSGRQAKKSPERIPREDAKACYRCYTPACSSPRTGREQHAARTMSQCGTTNQPIFCRAACFLRLRVTCTARSGSLQDCTSKRILPNTRGWPAAHMLDLPLPDTSGKWGENTRNAPHFSTPSLSQPEFNTFHL